MAKNPDPHWRRARISATSASRTFSKTLDEIARGATYVVHRRGKDVCVMTAPAVTRRKASAYWERLRGRGADGKSTARLSAAFAVVVHSESVRQAPSEQIFASRDGFGREGFAISRMRAGESRVAVPAHEPRSAEVRTKESPLRRGAQRASIKLSG